jgi:photosystem II stability/assembly factor-like uncharacterized protein
MAVASTGVASTNTTSTTSTSKINSGDRVLVSTDGGAHWSFPADSGLVVATLRSVSCPSSGTCWVAGAAPDPAASGALRGTVMSTRDAGSSWTVTALPAVPIPASGASGASGGAPIIATGNQAHGSGSPVSQPVTASAPAVDDIASLACAGVATCLAVGMLAAPGEPSIRQLVLRRSGL